MAILKFSTWQDREVVRYYLCKVFMIETRTGHTECKEFVNLYRGYSKVLSSIDSSVMP